MQPCLTHCILPEDSFSTSDGATDNQDRIDASEFPGFTKNGSMNIFQNKKKADENSDFQPARIILDHLYD